MSEQLTRWSYKIGRLFAIDIRLSFIFVIWVAIEVLTSISYGLAGVAYTLLGMLFLFFIILVHEFGHCFAGRAVGGSADTVLLWPLGGLAFVYVDHRPTPHLVTAVGGPAVNVILFLLVLPLYLSGNVEFSSYYLGRGGGHNIFEQPLTAFAAINLDLLLFNLVPAFPMDGGRILRDLLWYRIGYRRATVFAVYVSYVCAALMLLVGFGVFRYNENIFLIFIALFVVMGASQEKRMAESGYGGGGDGFSIPDYGTAVERPSWWQRRRMKALHHRQEKEARAQRELDSQLDDVLEKVHREGISNLTAGEKKLLQAASRRYRKD